MYKGGMVPTGKLSERLEQEFYHRVIGMLVPKKRPIDEAVGTGCGGQGEGGLPSKIRQIDLPQR